MNVNYLENNIDILNEESFVLDKEIWDKYNMVATKENVVEFMREYKEARAECFKSIISKSMTADYDPNKVFVPSRINNGGFADDLIKKLDSQEIINNTEPLLKEIVKTFTPREKIYYDYHLCNNYSEEYVIMLLGLSSKNGLKPVKHSCVLKIALIFNIAVLKE